MDLKARFIIEGFLAGLHASPFHGFSVEFSEHRKYVPGDDPALIDYHAWARTDKYYVRRFQAETNLSCYLLVDTSASMSYASRPGMTKLEYAICLSAALGYLMLRQQDSVGMVTFDDRIRAFVPPRSTRGQLNNLLALLARPTAGAPTDLAPALHQVARRIRKRSLFILFSDLLDDAPATLDALAHLAFGGHDIIVFQVLDPAESNFDLEGPLQLRDPETGEVVTTEARAVRHDYLQQLADMQQQYRQTLERLKADFVTVETSTPFDRALVSYLLNRRKRF